MQEIQLREREKKELEEALNERKRATLNQDIKHI